MLTVGVDPGLSGAIALVHGSVAHTWPIPVVKVSHPARRKNRVSTQVNGAELRTLVADLALLQPECVWIEQVGGMPRDGAHRAFTFGATFGRICEAFEGAGLRVRLVAPAVWRAKLGVRGYAAKHALDTKESSRRVASELWPASAGQWKLKGNDVDCRVWAALS
jgi:hypothetical protein